MNLHQGVILDAETLNLADLDIRRLRSTLAEWQDYDHSSPGQLVERIKTAEVVISNKVMLGAHELSSAKNLKLICVAATGTNNIDLSAARARGITVCNAQNYATESVVQHALSLLLMLFGNGHRYAQDVGNGLWQQQRQFCFLHHPIQTVHGKTLGIIGYGHSGQHFAALAKSLGMKVQVAQLPWRPLAGERYALKDVLASSDVLSLHCPLTPETENLINAQTLAQMKTGAYLLNIARGGLVDLKALCAALESGHLAGAALDVLPTEPPTDIPQARNLIITPHIAWAAQSARQLLIDQIAENIEAYKNGQVLRVVN